MLPAVSVEARGEVGEGERARRWLSRAGCGVREVSISGRQVSGGSRNPKERKKEGFEGGGGARKDRDRGRGRGKKGEGSPYGIGALLVPPRDAAREPRRQERGYGLRRLHREQERGVPIGILADAVVFMAGVNQEFLYPPSSAPCFNGPPPKRKRGRVWTCSRRCPPAPVVRLGGARCCHCLRNLGSAGSWGCS